MANLTIINLKISQSLTQSQEAILELYNHLYALQAQMNTNKPANDNSNRDNKLKNYC